MAPDGTPHRYSHGWVRVGGDAPGGRSADKISEQATGRRRAPASTVPSAAKIAKNATRPPGTDKCENCDKSSGLITNVDYDENDNPITETAVCDFCDGKGYLVPSSEELAARAKSDAMNARLREQGIPGFSWTGTKWVKD